MYQSSQCMPSIWQCCSSMSIYMYCIYNNNDWEIESTIQFSATVKLCANDRLPVVIHLLFFLILRCKVFLLLLVKCIFLLCHPYLTKQNVKHP